MAEQPPTKKEEEEEPQTKETKKDPSSGANDLNRIIILEERDIPFEEERPPNFSPHFAIKVHRVHKKERSKEDEE